MISLVDLKTSDDQCGGRERKSEHFGKIRFPTFIQNIFHIDPKSIRVSFHIFMNAMGFEKAIC